MIGISRVKSPAEPVVCGLSAGGSRIRTVGSAETKVGIRLLTLIMKSLSAADSPPIELTEEDRPGETKVGDDSTGTSSISSLGEWFSGSNASQRRIAKMGHEDPLSRQG
jgi:hypothetical protein